jgi:hypothetical protein
MLVLGWLVSENECGQAAQERAIQTRPRNIEIIGTTGGHILLQVL